MLSAHCVWLPKRFEGIFLATNTGRHAPQYQDAHTDDKVRYEGANGRHVDELFKIEYGRQQTWKKRFINTIKYWMFGNPLECTYLPAPNPQTAVATTGVLVFSLIFDKKPNSRPSLDIAYKMRGIGNKHPNKLYMCDMTSK